MGTFTLVTSKYPIDLQISNNLLLKTYKNFLICTNFLSGIKLKSSTQERNISSMMDTQLLEGNHWKWLTNIEQITYEVC